MSTRDRIQQAVKELLREIAAAIDDTDVALAARQDLMRLYAGIDYKLRQFNQPTGPDQATEGGPTDADIRGEVKHDG